MSQKDVLAPGKVLPRALINPANGQVVLRAGTELTKANLEQIKKEGLETALKSCMAQDAPPDDLGDFDIDIPELPSFVEELRVTVPPPPPPPPVAAAPTFSPETGYGVPPAPPAPLRETAAAVAPARPAAPPSAPAPAAAAPAGPPAYAPPPAPAAPPPGYAGYPPPPPAAYAPPPAPPGYAPPPPAYGPPPGYGAPPPGYAPPERTAYQAPSAYAPPPAYSPRPRYDGGLPPRLISPYSDKLGTQSPPPGAGGPGGLTTNRYYHNPAHLLNERTVRQLMLCSEILEEHVRQGRTPPYEPIREVVDEVIDRLGSNIQQLNHGIEIRITGQPAQRSHAPNVMLLSLVMGLALNYNQREMVTLALGALCHDIGKTAIAPELLGKVGPLSPAEIELLRTHPTMGKRIMSRLPWSSPLIATIVHQHHERNDGSGYPQRLLDTQIYDLAKIVALAEVYDGLLQVQPYRPAVVPEAAYKLVCNWEKTRLDPEVAHAFQRFVVPYPLYAYVILDTQEIAQVVYVNPQEVTRPVVKLRGELIDMAWTPERKIVGLHIQPFDPA